MSPSVQAQGLPQGWTATPCDASGKSITTYSSQGFYLMDGTQSTTVTNTYPAPYLASFGTKPITTTSGPSVPPSFAALGIYDGGVNAYNSVGYDQYCYLVDPSFGSPDMGLINGGVTTKLTGQLCFYFKVSWQGMGPAGMMPDHIDLLLKTTMTATASINYGNADLSSGSLVASATASDGSPFNDTASAVGVAGAADAPPVVNYHLVRAAVDPNTGIAEVYLNGTGTESAVDTIPYGPFTPMGGYATNGATSAQASASVEGAVAPDTRSVTISSSLGQTSHKSDIHFDSNNVALPDPDVPTSDGTTNATSVKPDPIVDELITYYATPAGLWAANSAYFWHINEGNPYLSSPGGTFTLPNDPIDTYAALYSLSSTTGGREHVYIHLTDAGDSANATNNYYIEWHDPGELWQNQGVKSEISPKLFGTSDSAQPANGFDNVKITPDEVDWSTASHIGGGIVTTAAGVLAIAQPETSPFVIGFLAAAGYTLSVATPPDPTIYTPQGTEQQFEADVNAQVQINNGNTSGVFMPSAPRISPKLAQTIATSGDYQDYFTGLIGPGFHFSVQVYRHRFNQNRVGDGYGTQGYYGQVSGILTTSGSLEYVYNWH